MKANSNIYKLRRIIKNDWSKVSKFSGTTETLIPTLDKNLNAKLDISLEELTELEKIMGYKEGEITNRRSSFWKETKLNLTSEAEIEFDSSIPDDKLKLAWLKAKPQVAKNIEELDRKPNAHYVLISVEEEEKKKSKAFTVLREANQRYANLSTSEVMDMLYIYGINPSEMSFDGMQNALYEQMQQNPSKFLSLLDDPIYDKKVFLNKLVKTGVVKQRKAQYWTENEELIGVNQEAALNFLMDDLNKNVIIALQASLENRMKGIYSDTTILKNEDEDEESIKRRGRKPKN